jgi:hypothetical protein
VTHPEEPPFAKWPRRAGDAIVAVAVGLVAAALAEQVVVGFWAHFRDSVGSIAEIAGLIAGLGTLAIARCSSRRRAVAGCVGAAILLWAAGCMVSLAPCLGRRDYFPCHSIDWFYLVVVCLVPGGLSGAGAAVLVDARIATRASGAADAGHELVGRVGAGATAAGAAIIAASAHASVLPLALVAFGMLLLTLVLFDDRRAAEWIRRARRPRGSLAIRPATDEELDVRPLWSDDGLAGDVLVQQTIDRASPYRAGALLRPLGRVGDGRAVERRLLLAFACLLGYFVALAISALRA